MIEEQKYQNPEKEGKSEKNVYFEDTQSIKSHKSVEKNQLFEDAQSVKSHKSIDHDTQSVKSHKSIEHDTVSIKSMKSYISTSDLKIMNPPLNFPDYISEEDSESERSDIQSSIPPPKILSLDIDLTAQARTREIQASLIASQLGPLFDRLGRLLVGNRIKVELKHRFVPPYGHVREYYSNC